MALIELHFKICGAKKVPEPCFTTTGKNLIIHMEEPLVEKQDLPLTHSHFLLMSWLILPPQVMNLSMEII